MTPRRLGASVPEPAADATPTTTLRPRRSPRLIAAGVMLACLGGLGGAMAYQEATHANQVVVMQRGLARGEVVRQSDLSVVTIGAAPGVRTLAAGSLPSLVGKQALVDLPQGSLVGEGSVGTPALAAGQAQLGIKLSAGRIPGQPLPAGTPVELVEISGEGAEFNSLVVQAIVLAAPEKLPDGSSHMLDVAVPQSQAQRLADLAAHDRMALVRKAGG